VPVNLKGTLSGQFGKKNFSTHDREFEKKPFLCSIGARSSRNMKSLRGEKKSFLIDLLSDLILD